MRMAVRLFTLALAPLLLTSCVLAPGKFVSALTLLADRSFTFTYTGEVIAIDLAREFGRGMAEGLGTGRDGEDAEPSDSEYRRIALEADDSDTERDAKLRAMAEQLSKQAGFRSVRYRGDGVFDVDYAITSRLTHGFVFPYDLDAEVMFPFLAIELRGDDRVRVRAPAFAAAESAASGAGNKAAEKLDGTFTLVTDAEIVSQNSEDGAARDAGRATIRWRATPLSKDAPTAILKVVPLS